MIRGLRAPAERRCDRRPSIAPSGRSRDSAATTSCWSTTEWVPWSRRDARSFRPSRRTCSDRNCRRSATPSTSSRSTQSWRRAASHRVSEAAAPRGGYIRRRSAEPRRQRHCPMLRELGVPAAFFLSGRALHGLGAYWFQHLEALLVAHGEPRAAALLGLPGLAARSWCWRAKRVRTCGGASSDAAADLARTGSARSDGRSRPWLLRA